jgi:hypothetical protein
MPVKDQTLMGAGLIAIVLGILVGRFVYFEAGGFSLSSFLSGMLSGMGIVLILYSLWKRRKA